MERKWGGPEIKFGFLDCPICKKDLAHPALEEVLAPILQVIRAL
jgi:E3 ubiquitin-protein ligase MYCBP2